MCRGFRPDIFLQGNLYQPNEQQVKQAMHKIDSFCAWQKNTEEMDSL